MPNSNVYCKSFVYQGRHFLSTRAFHPRVQRYRHIFLNATKGNTDYRLIVFRRNNNAFNRRILAQ